MKRLIYTVATGKRKYGLMAQGLGRSLAYLNDPTPRAILTDLDGPWDRYFHHVIRPTQGRTALDKLTAFDYLPDAEAVLAIDCDALAIRPVSPIFEVLAGRDFAVQGYPMRDGEWHGASVAGLCARYGVASVPRFNGGLLYYQRSEAFARLRARATEFERSYADLEFGAFRGNASEEVCLQLAMLEAQVGTAVPDEMDFQATGVGLVGPLRLDIERGVCEMMCRRERMRFIRPYIFHASRFANFLVYWKQLDRLARLVP